MARRNNNNSRNTRRRKGGRRNNTRKSRSGVLSYVYTPVNRLLGTGNAVLRTGLNTAVNVPVKFVVGAKNTVRNSSSRLIKGARNIGTTAVTGVNSAVGALFHSRKNKKSRRASRRSRRASRRSRRASRRSRRHSRR
jgi:hypothetical protein